MSWVELAWTLMTSTALIGQLLLVREAKRDGRAARLLGENGDVRKLVRSHVRTGRIFVGIHGLLVAAGISALLESNEELPMTLDRAIRIGFFMLAAAGLVIVSWLDLRDRRR